MFKNNMIEFIIIGIFFLIAIVYLIYSLYRSIHSASLEGEHYCSKCMDVGSNVSKKVHHRSK